MDANLARGIVTIVMLTVFIGIVLWAWSGKRKQAFDAAARLPLDEETEPGVLARSRRNGETR